MPPATRPTTKCCRGPQNVTTLRRRRSKVYIGKVSLNPEPEDRIPTLHHRRISRAPSGNPGRRARLFSGNWLRGLRSAAGDRDGGDALQVADAWALHHPLDPGV